ncbi:MAG: SMI1/KNR4 family protein [Myxococcota bacterium]
MIEDAFRRALAALSHVAKGAEDLSRPLTEGAVTSLASALGQDVPADLLAILRIRNGGWRVFEYDALPIDQIQRRWEGLVAQLEEGAFEGHEVFASEAGTYKAVKWSRGFVPFAEDGGGNLLLVDVAPEPKGKTGQVLRWERQGGPGMGSAPRTLGEYLQDYAALLESGDYVFDEEGFYEDGPFVDAMYP